MKFIAAIVIALVFIKLVNAFSVSTTAELTETPATLLQRYLSLMVLHLPNITGIDPIVYTATSVTCKNITMGSLSSSFQPPSSLGISINQLNFQCTADWAAPHLLGSGALSFNVGIDTRFNLTVTQSSAGVSSCSVTTNIPEVVFTGTPKLLVIMLNSNVAQPKFIATLDSLISSTLCYQLKSIATEMNQALELINILTMPYIDGVKPNPVKPAPTGSINLQTSLIVNILSGFINQGFGTTNINEIVNILTDNTGKFSLDASKIPDNVWLKKSISFKMFNQTWTIGYTNITISGVNSWSDIEWISPITNSTVEVLKFILDNLEIKGGIYIDVEAETTNPTATLFASFMKELIPVALNSIGYPTNQIDVTVSKILFDTQMQIVINQKVLDAAMTRNKLWWSRMICLSPALDTVLLSKFQFDLSPSNIVFRASGSVVSTPSPADIALSNLVNNVGQLLTNSLKPLIPLLMDFVSMNMILPSLNTSIDTELQLMKVAASKSCAAVSSKTIVMGVLQQMMSN